jgi:hypothetical protein
LNDFCDAEGFIDPLTVGSDMDHIRLDAEDGEHDEGEVVVGRHEDLRAGIPCIFRDRTSRIDTRGAHLRPGEVVLIGTYSDIQIIVSGLCKALIIVKTNDHPFGLIEDRGKACVLLLLCFTNPSTGTIGRAIQICAVAHLVGPGRGITDAEARGVFDDQPGKE